MSTVKSSRSTAALVGAAVMCGVLVAGASEPPRPPGPDDRCAVCGMFVHKYPDWLATTVFADGGQVFFDGPKDMFRYLLDLEKYGAGDREIAGVWVTEYYRVQSIDALTAFFVTGSDVMGPMGGELVPFATREEAEAFAVDHGGKEILEFAEV
ncbi:MAG TPA: nitrous oxide reductase accessory protein NosL, partial [Candidatus Sulfomarinibacteraceae bacterium]|nr:nitrous oxide reductase accessory protein NosL [Candidatus Sulfomarinibacteraceae bacterium]